MAWMLPLQDHSLWEILRGSQAVGMQHSEDLTDALTMDRTATLPDVSENELHNNVCKDALFPDEIVYKTIEEEQSSTTDSDDIVNE